MGLTTFAIANLVFSFIAVASEIRKSVLRRRKAADEPGVPRTADDAVAVG